MATKTCVKCKKPIGSPQLATKEPERCASCGDPGATTPLPRVPAPARPRPEMRDVKCEMKENCAHPVTHIGSKGYVYCAACAVIRRGGGHERCRKMRKWELALIHEGKPLPSYNPKPVPACAASMGCLCAAHARGAAVTDECNTSEG